MSSQTMTAQMTANKYPSLRPHQKLRQLITETATSKIGETIRNRLAHAKPIVITSTDELRNLSISSDIIGIDLETTGLDWYRDEILLISLSTDITHAIVIDTAEIDRQALSDWVNSVLHSVLVVGHNLAFDLKFLSRWCGFDVGSCIYYDTMLSNIIFNAGLDYGNSLEDVARYWIGLDLEKDTRKDFSRAGRALIMSDRHYQYAALDALVTLPIRELQMTATEQRGMYQVVELEMRLLPAVVAMELGGVPFDWSKFEAFVQVLGEKRFRAEELMRQALLPAAERLAEKEQIEKGLLFAMPREVNINSKPVCRNGIWNYGQFWPALCEYGIEIVDKEGNPSLSARDIQRWDHQHEVDIATPDGVDELLNGYHMYRNKLLNLYAYTIAINKLYDSFVKTISEMYRDGKLYPWFKQLGAKATGRFSSNLQQLPKDDKVLPLGLPSLRQCIAAESGHKLIIADFAGIELVILADMSGDDLLGDLIVRSAMGEDDIHLYVVRQAFSDLFFEAKNATLDKKKIQPYATLRNAAKPTSYGIAYGITGIGLSETINQQLAPLGVTCTPKQAQQIIDNWKYRAFKKAGAWLDRTARQGQQLGYVSTAIGRYRYFHNRGVDNKELAAIGREASNAPIQGTCADMLKLSMIYLHNTLDPFRARLILTVHDELVVHATADYAAEAQQIVKHSMEKAARKCLPRMGQYVVVDPAISDCYDK